MNVNQVVSRLYVNNARTDTSSSSSKSASFGSSAYLLQRLSMLSLFVFVVTGVSMLGRFVIAEISQTPLFWQACHWALLGGALAVYLLLKLIRPRLKVVKVLAMVFQIFASYTIASLEFAEIQGSGLSLGVGISKVCIIALIFPLFVHGSITRNLLLAALGALMIPLSYWVQLRGGMVLIPNDVFLQYCFINFLICTASVVPTSVINRFERSLERAKAAGSYEFLDDGFIGKGGMGEVWKARHSMLLRPAAIKVFKREVSFNEDPIERRVAAKRFKREAQAIASLQSPHTVEIYDVGTCQKDFSYYYAMEFLDGLDLKRFIEKYGPVTPERAVFLLKQICHSLHNAHESGMIHRDVKPANILICRYGSDYDFVKVLDFGLVKLLGKSRMDETQITHTKISTGTPAFLAPEMAMSQSVDARTDIYSLGCVAFWMLTGELVFEADTSVQMAVKHIQEEAPDVRSRSEFEISDRFAKLIASCLEKNPQRRPQSISDVYEVLKKIDLEMGPSSKWSYQKARNWWQRHKPTHSSTLKEKPNKKKITHRPPSIDRKTFEVRPSL